MQAVTYYKNGYIGQILNEKGEPQILRESPKNEKGSFNFKDLPSHSKVFVILFKIFNIPKDSLNEEFIKPIFLVSTILACLSTAILFLAQKKYLNNLGAIISSLFLTLVPVFISRTIAGFSDTDGYVVFFPILIFIF